MAIKKGMIEEILHEPTQERAALQRGAPYEEGRPFRLPPSRIAENTRPALTGSPHRGSNGFRESEPTSGLPGRARG